MDSMLSKRNKLLLIILSLFWHLMILYTLFVFKENQKKISQQSDNEYEIRDILSLSPQTTVLFQEEPEPQEKAQQAQEENPTAASQPSEPTHSHEIEQSNDDRTASLPDTTITEQKSDTPQAPQPDQEKVIQQKKPSPPAAQQVKHPIRKIKQQQIITPRKKQVTLADIAKGFIKSVERERENQASALPDGKQLSLQIYGTKIWSLLEQSAKAQRSSIFVHTPVDNTITVVLTIGKNGSLINAQLKPPTKEPSINSIIFSIIKNAGLFPPIPNHLGKKQLTLQYPLRIKAEPGYGVYELSYGPTR